MSADTAIVLSSALALAASALSAVVVVVLCRRTAEMRRLVDQLQSEALPLVRRAGVVVDQAATEMERVGDVLGSAEAVTATVDSASRLAYRAFSNPVVGVMAFGTGAAGAVRRFFGRPLRPPVEPPGAQRPPGQARRRHRHRRPVVEGAPLASSAGEARRR